LFKYAIVSDTHIRPPGESSSPWQTNLLTNDRARWVAEQVNSHRPDLVIHLGDVVHPVPHLPTYGSASKIANEIMDRIKTPVHYVPGNHDVGDKDNPTVPSYVVNESYQEKFMEHIGPLYQSFGHRGVHFVLINSPILNSGIPHEAEQREWLEADLEEHRGNRIHVFSHYPPYIYTPHEPSNYDNLDEPARSWLLGLLEEHGVEALFAGHVHHYGYKHYGDTRIHNLLSTCFVRQDYAEMFRVEAADEYGRNDAAKLGYCTVEVYEEGHAARIHRSFGMTLGPDETPERKEKPQPVWGPAAPLGVHLRHPLAEAVTLPYNGPIDEFVRKKAWNDYTLLGLLETGVKELRLPLGDPSSR
jgi:3',5'-cyclic AMP phosphodiesterase CpdA